MKINPIEEVRKFHEAMSLTIGNPEAPLSRKDVELRVSLISEEVNETAHALTSPKYDPNTILAQSEKAYNDSIRLQVLDGLCDIIYVSAGSVVSRGSFPGFNEMVLSSFGIDRQDVIDLYHPIFYGNLAKELLMYGKYACQAVRDNGAFKGIDYAMPIHTYCAGLDKVCEQIADLMQLPLEAAFVEVQNANMSKRLKDGTVFHDKRGKVRKPPGWIGPDLKHVLETGEPSKRDLFTTPPEEYPTAEVIASTNDWVIIPPKYKP